MGQFENDSYFLAQQYLFENENACVLCGCGDEGVSISDKMRLIYCIAFVRNVGKTVIKVSWRGAHKSIRRNPALPCIVDCHALDFYSRTCDWNSINVPFPISHLSAALQKSYYHSPIYSVISLRYHCSCTRGDGFFKQLKTYAENTIEYDKIQPGCEFLDKNTKRT